MPDENVSEGRYPPWIPRAALTLPHTYLHLAPSIIPGAGTGVFTKVTLPRGVRFGPYCGVPCQAVESGYCWEILDRNRTHSHHIDAADPARSNWLRYVNCARHWREENLIAFPYKGQIYYRTFKEIPPFTELLVRYGDKYALTLQIDLEKYYDDEYYNEILSHNTVLAECYICGYGARPRTTF